jgi:hypothetical protein
MTVKEFGGLLTPFITPFFNISFNCGCFQAKYKNAVVFPLLSKEYLDRGLITLLHKQLHWLDMAADRVNFRLGSQPAI